VQLDAEPSAEDSAILQSLMSVGRQDGLEFLGGGDQTPTSRLERREVGGPADEMLARSGCVPQPCRNRAARDIARTDTD
jgi:hypothetical protein